MWEQEPIVKKCKTVQKLFPRYHITRKNLIYNTKKGQTTVDNSSFWPPWAQSYQRNYASALSQILNRRKE